MNKPPIRIRILDCTEECPWNCDVPFYSPPVIGVIFEVDEAEPVHDGGDIVYENGEINNDPQFIGGYLVSFSETKRVMRKLRPDLYIPMVIRMDRSEREDSHHYVYPRHHCEVLKGVDPQDSIG